MQEKFEKKSFTARVDEIHYEESTHTTYSRNNMGQKCEGNCGLWVLNEIIIKKKILKIWKKIVEVVW